MKNDIKLIILKYRRMLIAVTNCLIISVSFYLAFLLRFDLRLPTEYLGIFIRTMPLAIVIKFIVFYYFGLFRGLWRYVSIGDLWQIIKAGIVSSAIFIVSVVFSFGLHGFPRSVFINDFIICTFLTGGIRFLTRLIRERFKNIPLPSDRSRVLIVGAGDAGILTLKQYRNNPLMGEVMGFIDDDNLKHGETISGIKVLGGRDKIGEFVNLYSINEIILSMPSVKGEVIRDLVVTCKISEVKLKIIPDFTKILKGELEIKPREVSPEDLLGREPVAIDENEIAGYLKGKKVLLTGAGGSIGSELCRQVANFSPSELIMIDHNESSLYFLILELKSRFKNLHILPIVGDIMDVGMLKKVFSENKPQVVFHAAAYKHVPLMEENPISAVKNNSLGSRNIIYASHHYKVERLVLISTDKAVNPINIMGFSKRLAEIFLQAKAKQSKTKFMAVRFGNVLGSNGSVVPLFKKQIENGGPITITHPEATRYFMSIKEAVLLVLQAGAMGTGGEIFILDMGEQIKISELAKNLVALSGLELGRDIAIEYTGLRPGEKIREELLQDKDKDKVTKHNKIYISPANDFNLTTLRGQIKSLDHFIGIMDTESVIKKIKEIVGK